MNRIANAKWKGTGLEGTGVLSTKSGAFNNQPYSFKTRFKNEDGTLGTNPEELIAAAHAGCFNMALSFQLGATGYTPVLLDTQAVIKMENIDGHFTIVEIELNLTGQVPNITKEEFEKIAENAKATCPISQALSAVKINLNTSIVMPV